MQTIRDPSALSSALEAIHGRIFSAEHVLYDPEARVLSVSLARRDTGEPPLSVRNLGLLYRRWRVPLRETTVRVRRVRAHEIERGEWRLSGLGFEGDTLTFLSGPVAVVRVRVDGLDLSVIETPHIVGERVESCVLGFLRRSATRRTDGP